METWKKPIDKEECEELRQKDELDMGENFIICSNCIFLASEVDGYYPKEKYPNFCRVKYIA